MIAHMKDHPEDIDEAIKLAVVDKQPYSWRAAWLLWSLIDENDPRIKPYIKDIIDSIATKADGHQRELLKILLKMELNEDHEGYVFNICMNLWEQINKKPSVRFTAFVFIVKLAKKYPELRNELKFLTQIQYMETLSPGVKRSLARMIKSFTSVAT
jgi:hypothetical protein